MRLIFFLSLLMPGHLTLAAQKPLANFSAGTYVLSQGTAAQCGDGEFKMFPDGKGVQLGVHHGFNTETGSNVLKSDIPDEKGCLYDVRDTVTVNSADTVLSFNETLRCGGEVRSVLQKIARITPRKVEIHVKQKGGNSADAEPSFEYRCVFNKK
jgi:hypothetical protein